MTHLEMVNKILRRLREDEVNASTENTDSIVVAEIVADAVQMVGEAFDWERLKHRTIVDVSDGTAKYRLDAIVSNGGNVRNSDVRLPVDDSELQWMGKMPQAWLYDDDNDDETDHLVFLSPEAFREVKARDRDDTEDDPIYFTIYPESDATNGTRLFLEFYPEPDAARVFEAIFWTPQAELEADGTTDNTEILVPNRPAFQIAMMYAINERGEELGEPGNMAEERANQILAVAIEKEIRQYGRAGRYDWSRC